MGGVGKERERDRDRDRDRVGVGGVGKGRAGEHCHHQNDSCVEMVSDEGHFNVSLVVRDKVPRQCSQTTTLLMRKESR